MIENISAILIVVVILITFIYLNIIEVDFHFRINHPTKKKVIDKENKE